MPRKIRRYLAFIFFLLFPILQNTSNAIDNVSKKVLVLQSDNNYSFNVVRKELIENLVNEGITNIEVVNLWERKDISFINPKNIEVVVAIGSTSLKMAVSNFPNTPVAFSMVLDYIPLTNTNTCGVSLFLPQETILLNIKYLFPSTKRFLILSSRSLYYNYYANLEKTIKEMGLASEIVFGENPKEIEDKLNYLDWRLIDAVWLLPDPSLVTKDLFLKLANYTKMYKKLFIVFSENFVKAGGTVSLSPNYEAIGSQLALLVIRILSGEKPSEIGVSPPLSSYFVVNEKALEYLDIDINPSALNIVDKWIK